MATPACRAILAFALTMLTAATASAVDWAHPGRPYRTSIKLDQPITGQAVVELDHQRLLDDLAAAAVDQVDGDSFAYEKAVLVNPDTGKAVGRFELVRLGEPLPIDGDFTGLQQGASPWLNFDPSKTTIEPVEIAGQTYNALMIEEKTFGNHKLYQPVQLVPGQTYLLEYWLTMDPQENEMGVMLNNPNMRLFAQLPHSYFNKMPPLGEWARYRVLFRPHDPEAQLEVRPIPTDAYLEVHHAFVGKGGVADLRLQRVAWKLVVEPDAPIDELHLYMVGRAGHRMTVPTEELITTQPPRDTVVATHGAIEAQRLNPRGVRVRSASGKSGGAWTIDPALPLKVGAIRQYDPGDAAADAASVTLFNGGSASLVIAVDSGTPRLDGLKASTDLPAEVTFRRIATVPVYDGPTVDGEVKGELIETRYDPMVPLDYALDPDSTDGIHLVIATFTASDATTRGRHTGSVTLAFNGETLDVPVVLHATGVTLKPKHHFGTLFGGIHFVIANPKGYADMADDSISVAQYHGYKHGDLTPRTIMSLSIPDTPDPRMAPYRDLAEGYFDVMLDHHLLPQSPALYAWFKYDVIEQGNGKAPKLTNWDFSLGYDEAVKTFVIGRDMPWLMVGRSNGSLMHKITLSNGKTYSVRPNPDDANWVQLPREAFNELLGDYWDAFAKHLDELGVLDRAIFVVDETQPETFTDVYEYITAMRSRPYAKHIMIGHTTHKTSSYIRRTADGELMMDELLDVPMPQNDEHFNFFEPEWHARFERPGKESWVYYVETDHMNLENAGVSTTITPLKLRNFGVDGWYCWEAFVWSLPYAYLEGEMGGFKYKTGPVTNPWKNPFYHHGPGVLSYFYPPDPRGFAEAPTNLIIPSFRLTLMRDGIQYRAIVDALNAGHDDAGRLLTADPDALGAIDAELAKMWADNPVQWYLEYDAYRTARELMNELLARNTP